MRKAFAMFLLILMSCAACQPSASTPQPQPTAVPPPTAFPSLTPLPPSPTPLSPTVAPTIEMPAAGTERTSAVDGMIQAYIPEGTFRMGGMDPRAGEDEKPDYNVSLRAFWMDTLEVTNGMYALCVQAGACEPPRALKSEKRPSYFGNPEFNDYPVVYVTWSQAAVYCQWAGRRLPTEAEWERAARGDDFRTWPWGDDLPDYTRANFNYLVGDTSRVGSNAAGASPFGILDMAGNVAEWVNDFYDANYYKHDITTDPAGPQAGTRLINRVVRGGSFQDAEVNIRVSKRSSVLGSNPNAELNSPAYSGEFSPKIGFRCAADE